MGIQQIASTYMQGGLSCIQNVGIIGRDGLPKNRRRNEMGT